MGDRNYYSNQYNQFPSHGYRYGQYQQQPRPFSSNMPPHGGGFTVDTSMPVYNTGAFSSEAQSSGMHPASRDSPQTYQDDKLPSYEESRNDLLLSRPNINSRYSPAWNYVDNKGETKQNPPKNSFSNLFDTPGSTREARKSPDWSSDNYNSSQSFQEEPQGRFNPSNRFSQLSTNFSSDFGGRSDHRFSPYNQRGFGKQQNRGEKRGGFKRRGHWQNKGRPKNMDFEKDVQGSDKNAQGSDDEGNEEDGNDGDNRAIEKVNAFIPDPSVVDKFTYFPPSAEEMGEMFKDLVIHFFFKVPKNKKEQNPFVVICEAFRRSAGYNNISVEDGYDMKMKDRKFCTLRYCGIMLVRGIGENNCIKEPRVLAGVELINKLAMTCYTLESKEHYFNVAGFEKMLKAGSVPGVYIIVPKEEAPDFDSACKYLSSLEDSDVEYMFNLPHPVAIKLKGWANKKEKFDVRVIKDDWIGICHRRTTQYWRDKILASGSMETEKFKLTPPQGIGNLLIKNFNLKQVIVQLRTRARPLVCTLENVYGPPGVGPEISVALPPWERSRKFTRNKKSRQKERKIMEQIKQGVPLTEAKGFKFLSKNKKRSLKKRLGQ